MPSIELAVYFATPFVAGAIVRRRGLSWLDPVLTCYGVGLLLGNLPIAIDQPATQSVTEAVVPLAIPLLLFQTDFVRWLRTSRATLIGFTVAVTSVLVSLIGWSIAFGGAHPDIPLAAGMLSGTWTGGSPNLVSVGAALDVPHETFLLTNAADILVGGMYLLALLTFARPLLARVLPLPEERLPLELHGARDVPWRTRIAEGALSLLLAGAIVGASAGLAFVAFGELSAPWVILGITTGGIAASFVARIRALETSYDVGNYLILVFCVAIGALTDLGALLQGGSVLLAFTAAALSTTLLLHYGLCALLRIDVDTSIITSVATIMGPALVVPVAGRLNNRAAFVSGITSGLVGYAMGNYVGIAVARVVERLIG